MTPTDEIPEFAMLDKEKSIRRYFPPNGTLPVVLIFVKSVIVESCIFAKITPAMLVILLAIIKTSFFKLHFANEIHFLRKLIG